MASIFTRIIKGEIPSYKIAEDENFYAFLDINPVAPGHTLVVPKKETDYIFDMDDALLSGILLFAKKIVPALEKAVPCRRIGVSVIGLEVPHAHVHLIPLNSMKDINFSLPKMNPSQDELKEIQSKILSAI